MKRGVLIGSFVGLLLVLATPACNLAFGGLTIYCPMSHWFRDSSCVVLDRDGSRALIRHFDVDSSELSLEIDDRGQSLFFEVPRDLWPGSPQADLARLDSNRTETVVVGDRQIRLHRLDG